MFGETKKSALPVVDSLAALRHYATDYELLTDPKGAFTGVEFHLTNGSTEYVDIAPNATVTTTVIVNGQVQVRVLSLLRWEQL